MVAKGEPKPHEVTVGFEYSQPSTTARDARRSLSACSPSWRTIEPAARRGTIACLATIDHGSDPFRQLTEVIPTRCALREPFSYDPLPTNAVPTFRAKVASASINFDRWLAGSEPARRALIRAIQPHAVHQPAWPGVRALLCCPLPDYGL
jgi:hypothetical protein